MDPLEPIAPRPQLPSIDRAAPTRRVDRERDPEQDEARQRRRRERRAASDLEAEDGGERIDEGDDGRLHVDISV